jgi:hypothetical protein
VNKKLGVGLLIGLGALIVLWFGLRLARELKRMGPPPRPQPYATTTDVSLIRDWMTVPYIAHTYAVPSRVIFDALGIPEGKNHEKSLAEINTEYFPDQAGFVVGQVQQAIQDFQKQAPAPPDTAVPHTP